MESVLSVALLASVSWFFFRFMVMALSDYFEERLHLLTLGTLDDFNARGSVLMMQDHKHISGTGYRV